MEIREDLLHYAWQFQVFERKELTTTKGGTLSILHPGRHNRGSGPDFAEASLLIDGLRWAGAVECHVKSSDWGLHGHSADAAYDKVILHVVWVHDAEVTLSDGSLLPVLELRGLLTPSLLGRYQYLMDRIHPGPTCSPLLEEVPSVVITAMQERALLERLQAKASRIEALYEAAGRDWEETAYRTLAHAWGLPANGDPFLSLAEALPLKHLRRTAHTPFAIEALFLGQAGLLQAEEEYQDDALVRAAHKRSKLPNTETEDTYRSALAAEYTYYAGKLSLPIPNRLGTLQTGRMRPAQQPGLKLAQLAIFITQAPALFDAFSHAQGVEGLVRLFRVRASSYWEKRYSLGPEGKQGAPLVGYSTALGLVINAVIPLLAAYGRQRNQSAYVHKALSLLEQLPPEDNALTRLFTERGLANQDAAQSQGLLGLQKLYCQAGKCLQCQIGAHLLSKGAGMQVAQT